MAHLCFRVVIVDPPVLAPHLAPVRAPHLSTAGVRNHDTLQEVRRRAGQRCSAERSEYAGSPPALTAPDPSLPQTPHYPRPLTAPDPSLPQTPHCPRPLTAPDPSLPQPPAPILPPLPFPLLTRVLLAPPLPSLAYCWPHHCPYLRTAGPTTALTCVLLAGTGASSTLSTSAVKPSGRTHALSCVSVLK